MMIDEPSPHFKFLCTALIIIVNDIYHLKCEIGQCRLEDFFRMDRQPMTQIN